MNRFTAMASRASAPEARGLSGLVGMRDCRESEHRALPGRAVEVSAIDPAAAQTLPLTLAVRVLPSSDDSIEYSAPWKEMLPSSLRFPPRSTLAALSYRR